MNNQKELETLIEHIGCNSERDSNFMKWLVDRLIYVYDEDEQTDWVLRTRQIADKLEKIENKEKAKQIADKLENKEKAKLEWDLNND